MTARRSERGTAAIEFVLFVPALLVLLAVVIGAGRVVSTKSAVLTIARESARVAADAPDAATAEALAYERAAEVAEDLGLDPTRVTLKQDAGDFARGTPYQVSVSYRLRLSDLPAFGLLPGSFIVVARHTEHTDAYRSR